MPLTPHGSPLPGGGMSAQAALLFGGLVLVGGLLVALLAQRPVDGVMFIGFGAAMLAWGGLLAGRGNPRLLLALGVLGALAALGAALRLVVG